jgi:beta-galactosidase
MLNSGGDDIDRYETPLEIWSVEFAANSGFLVNGERVQIQNVNQHHDLGALGAAFNERVAKRQLEVLRELGFLVIDEIFDS